jgi:hypothetical protein
VVQRAVEETLTAFREIFKREPSIAQEMLNLLDSPEKPLRDPTERRMFSSLIRMFRSKNSRYLDFYGPAGTFNTLPYHKALNVRNRPDRREG